LTTGNLVGLASYDFNLQKAKEYMAKSKYSKGLTLSFMTSTTWRVNALQIIQQQLAPLGIKVTIDEVDAARLTSKASAGNYNVLMYSVALRTGRRRCASYALSYERSEPCQI
jgi:Bacterial extracellular solute-binding proteins, family 5 Middle.